MEASAAWGKKTDLEAGVAMRLEILEGEHAEIIIDSPGKKVNVLDRQALTDLHNHLAILKTKTEIKTLLIYSAKPDIFLAGADINEIQLMKTKEDALKLVEQMQDIFNELDNLPQVTMALIDGPCMGGGTELALSCDYRVCSDNPRTKIGLPEVQLGVLPGAGGTQRAPRLLGIVDAITMITSGAAYVGPKALKLKLVDDLMPTETMLEIARRKMRDGSYKKYLARREKTFFQRLQEMSPLKSFVFKQARKQIMAKTKGQYPAVLKALSVIEETLGGPLKQGLAIEALAFAELAISPVAKNLIGIFFGSEELKKQTGILPHEAPNFKPKKYQRVGVIGAGIMGGGIAAVASSKSIEVHLKDIADHSIATALKTAQSLFDRDLKKKKIDRAEFLKRRYRIIPSLKWVGFGHLPIVVEAVIERMSIKKDVIADLEKILPVDAIIATNTSSLSISEMASEARHPERIVGMHFFNPVPMMPLVEVVRAEKTSPEVVAQTVAFGKQLGKTVIVVKDSPGFLINRILMPFLIESGHLKQEGYSVAQIDKAATKFGMPMGPFRLMDEVGLDTGAKVADVIASGFPHMKVLPMIHEMVAKGYLGKKNGKGFYLYDPKGKPAGVRPEFQKAAMDDSEATDRSIQDRLILPMVTEATMALDEGIVSGVRELDLGLIYGIGFPPFKGGLLRWVSSLGEREILDRMNVVHNATKGRLIVPKAFVQRVQSGHSFYPSEA